MLSFYDSRKPNVIIASIGSFLLLIGSLITYAFFIDSRWGTDMVLLFIAQIMFGVTNVMTVVMSLYALVISYQNGWLSGSQTGRIVLSTAPYVLLFWTWRLCILIREFL
jgi:hypothetical protein